MSARLSRLALRCYPLAFRRRYGAEMRALLEDAPTGPGTVFDLLHGALAAHLRPPTGLDGVLADERVRASTSGVLACWVMFAAAGFGFYKTTEDHPFTAAGNAHTVLGGVHGIIQILAVVAAAAVVVGSAPLVVVAVREAHANGRLVELLRAPMLAIVVFGGLTAALITVAHSQHTHHTAALGRAVFIVWELAALGCAAICVLAARGAVFAVPLGRRALLGALGAATVVTAAMAGMAVGGTIYAIALRADAPGLDHTPNGPLSLTSTGVSLVVVLLTMTAATTLAVTTTRRGWRALCAGRGAAQ